VPSRCAEVCSYNVCEGGNDSLENYFANFLVRCEVAIINEANGWHVKKKAAVTIAIQYGYNMELLRTTHDFDIAVLTRKSSLLERGHLTSTDAKIFHHGLLHCVINQTLHVFATHLSPHSAFRRRREASRILELVSSIETQPIVLVGDLNTLSPFDSYSPNVLRIFQSDPRLSAKFLVKDNRTIDYEPMRILLSVFRDLHSQAPTVPTALRTDELHAVPMRLDYILMNDCALNFFRYTYDDQAPYYLTINPHIDNFTQRASDHYPVILTLNKEDKCILHSFTDAVLLMSLPL